MALLDDVLSRQPANTLYHYTTQAGLLGIIKRGEIWATHTRYLNDAREYRHAVDVVTAVNVKRLADALGDGRRVLADMAEGVKGADSMNVCDAPSLKIATRSPNGGHTVGLHRALLSDLTHFT